MNIRKIINVPTTQLEAFTAFTQSHGQWWPPVSHFHPAPTAHIEQTVGGRWFERSADHDEYVWGKVLAWDPPHGLVLSWQIGADGEFDSGLHTEVEVRFIHLSTRATLVRLEHRYLERYGQAAESQRSTLASDVGWGGILEHFARHCAPTLKTGNSSHA